MAQLGFVFWGLRNGFSNHLFSSHVDPSLPSHFTDDMRQICQGTIDAFYSIEKVSNCTLLTTYNPNTKDNFGRRGYTALSLVIPNGFSIPGNPLELLNKMMETYVTKQGNAMVTMVRIEDFQALLDASPLVRAQAEISHERTRIGLCYYQNEQELLSQLSQPNIYHFSKVYFSKSQNSALDRLAGIESVSTFQKPLFLQLSNFDPKWRAFKNGNPITSTRTPIKQGDTLLFQDGKTGRRKEFKVENTDIHLSGNDLFPPVVKPPKQSNEGNSKILLIVSACVLLLGVGGYFSYPYIFPSAENTIAPPPPPTEGLSLAYDYTEIKIKGNTETITDSSYFIVNQEKEQFATWDKSDDHLDEIDWNKFLGFGKKYYLIRVVDSSLIDSLIIKQVGTRPREHKVASGDNFNNIAMRYGIDIQDLKDYNPELNNTDMLDLDAIIHLVPAEPEDLNNRESNTPDESEIGQNSSSPKPNDGNTNPIPDESFDEKKDRIQKMINKMPYENPLRRIFQEDLDKAINDDDLDKLEVDVSNVILSSK